jgi:bacillithiol system protein YtxJ
MTIHRVDTADPADAASLLKGDSPRLIFKHSPTCGISTRAYAEVSVFAGEHPDVPVLLVDVIAQQALSRQLAVELGLPHASPQVILVAGGRPLWSASHGAVTGQAIGRALARALPGDAEGEDGPRTVR